MKAQDVNNADLVALSAAIDKNVFTVIPDIFFLMINALFRVR